MIVIMHDIVKIECRQLMWTCPVLEKGMCGCLLAASHTLKNDDKTSKTENFKEFQL